MQEIGIEIIHYLLKHNVENTRKLHFQVRNATVLSITADPNHIIHIIYLDLISSRNSKPAVITIQCHGSQYFCIIHKTSHQLLQGCCLNNA